MAATQVTIDARRTAGRMARWGSVNGHIGIIRSIMGAEQDNVYAMRNQLNALANPGAPGGMVAGLDNVCEHMRDASVQNGLLMFVQRMASDAAKIWDAADFLDNWQAWTPIVAGVASSIELANAAPLVTVDTPPLHAKLVNGRLVLIENLAWPSLAGTWWPIIGANSAAGTFRLQGADTSGESGDGAGANIVIDDAT